MSQTVIGAGTRIAGALFSQDDLVIEGTVEGPVVGASAVTIAAGAQIGGDVEGREVRIAGQLQHNVRASGVVRLAATADLRGDIEAPCIAIEEGAQFDGRVRMRRREAVPSSPAGGLEAAEREAVPSSGAGGLEPSQGSKVVERRAADSPMRAAPAAVSPAPATPREIPSLPALGKRRLVRRTR
jgi:cytoskeletal protein CcmA (bactofilin family)